jgi:hypothetical protein
VVLVHDVTAGPADVNAAILDVHPATSV